MKKILILWISMLGVLAHANEVTGQKVIQLNPAPDNGLTQLVWTNPGPHEIYVYTVQVVSNVPSFALGPYWVDIPQTANTLCCAETVGTIRDFTPNWVVVGVGQQIRLNIEGAQQGVEVFIWTTNPYDSAIYLQ